VQRWCPLTWEAFLDYRLHARSFSRLELELLSLLAQGKNEEAIRKAIEFGWLPSDFLTHPSEIKKHREREEFEMKMKTLQVKIPWQSAEE